MRGRKGFTLIELLVVIAIIAILAAMLFPVFARARESARKIQCLSNIKNIAIAVQMYLVDYERFPPSEHRAEVQSWFNEEGGNDCCCRAWLQNPYLRWPVILEDYTRNRDVWRCPSSRFQPTFMVNPCIPDWFTAAANLHTECSYASLCNGAFPPGWGGTITDSYRQIEMCAGPDTGGIEMGVGVASWHCTDLKTSAVKDPTRRVVCSDCGVQIDIARCSWVAYPDTCRIDGAACSEAAGDDRDGPCADWVNCDWTLDCGAGDPRFGTDAQYRKEHARARHLGGSNLGFADGHAAWMSAEAILWGGDEAHGWGRTNAPLEGLEMCGTFYPEGRRPPPE
jgi:prepilin-type N-terminal cleavage/methylation domain-containing protein/prepilin-type processing-associated H-X9-DG protein